MEAASVLSAGLATASFFAVGVVAVSYFREKYSQKAVITDALTLAQKAKEEAEAARATAEEIRDTLVEKVIAAAGIAKAEAKAASAQADAIAESLASVNAKLTARFKAEATRNRSEARAARSSEGEAEAEGQEEKARYPQARHPQSQESLFAQALEESRRQGGEGFQESHEARRPPSIAELKARDPVSIRIRRR